MAVKVLLSFSNLIFSEGIASLLEGQDDITYRILGNDEEPEECVKSFRPDVVLMDIITLYGLFGNISPTPRMSFVLVDTHCGEENIANAFVTRRVTGILTVDTDAKLLIKAIKVVSRGEIWIDNNNLKNLVVGLNAIKGPISQGRISGREREIVSLVASGHRNKEIAEKLCISEQTVKTHLYRIFKKLGLQNRSQLIVFALKNSDLTDGHLYEEQELHP